MNVHYRKSTENNCRGCGNYLMPLNGVRRSELSNILKMVDSGKLSDDRACIGYLFINVSLFCDYCSI